MKVYLVSSGEYSDYSIQAIFATKELAEAALDRDGADWRKYDSVRIEEYTLLTSLDRIEVWQASNDFWGKWRTTRDLVYVEDAEQLEERAWVDYREKGKKWWANGRAATPDRALKIARDALAKAKAERAEHHAT